MTPFILHLYDARQMEIVEGVTSFVGEDTTGHFGIFGRHTRFMTILPFGLVRFKTADSVWHYLALSGGLLYFKDNRMVITARHYVKDENFDRISQTLKEEMMREEVQLDSTKKSLRRLEEELLKRMWEKND